MSLATMRHTNYRYAVIFATNITYMLSDDNILPPHCTLDINNPYINEPETKVIIDFFHPRSNHIGKIIIGYPFYMNSNNAGGFAHMLCGINSHNDYFLQITVDNINELLGVIAFCQNILQYQPEELHLNFVRIPLYLLNHWCVSPELRNVNLEHLQINQDENYIYDPVVGI